MYDFSNKIAVVTGSGKGIGAAIAQRFYSEGILGVAMLDMDYSLVQSTARGLDPNEQRALAVKCDVSSKDDVSCAFEEIIQKFGKVDILINNAGVTRDAIFHKMTEDQWKKVIDVHLYGTFYCTQQVVAGMRERQYGKIVNISSTSAFGNPGQANYATAKAGIIGFTKTLARELGRKNVTVNCIAPGFIDTDIINTIPPEIVKTYEASIPMGRLGTPKELASLAMFLSSDECSFVTGECIVCAGGFYT